MKLVLVSRCAWTMYNFRRNIALSAQQDGYEVLCVGAESSDYGSRLRELGLRFEAVPLSGRSVNPLRDISTLRALRSVFCRERPDIVHNFTIKPVIYGSIAASSAGVPTLINTITGLGQVFSEEGNVLVRWVVEWLYRLSLPKGNHTFFQNSHDAAVFQRMGWFSGLRHSIVAGSGVDTALFDPARFAARDTKRGTTFLMVARLLREKGVIEFCEAARQVRGTYPDCRFRLVGGPDLQSSSSVSCAELRQFVESGDIEWVGAVDNVTDYLAEADVVVLPSYYREGIPRSLLEAGAMGKAIITTDWPGCRDAIVPGETGLLVAPRDRGALVSAMVTLLTEPGTIRRMGSAGQRFVRERFDERQIIETTLGIYRDCSSGKTRTWQN
jgi:glycosyltransferase involved in cell wall biosynthesis